MLNKLNLYVSFICVIILGNYCVKAEYEDEDNESSVVRIIDVDDNLRNSINIKIESLKSDFKEVFGSVRIIIKIDPSGQITKIDVIQNNLGDPEFIQDIEKNIKLWQFESSLVPKKGISVRFNVFFGKGGYTNNRILGCVGPILANNGMGFSLDIFRYQSRRSIFNFGQIHNLDIIKGKYDSAGIQKEYIELSGGTSVGLLMGHYKSPIVSLIDANIAVGNKDNKFMDYYFSIGSSQLLLIRFGRNVSFDIAIGVYEKYRFLMPNLPFSIGTKILIGIDFRLMQSMQDIPEY